MKREVKRGEAALIRFDRNLTGDSSAPSLDSSGVATSSRRSPRVAAWCPTGSHSMSSWNWRSSVACVSSKDGPSGSERSYLSRTWRGDSDNDGVTLTPSPHSASRWGESSRWGELNTAFRRLRSRSTRGFPVTGAIGGEKRGEEWRPPLSDLA